jgi:glutamine---fructose-6-phosphate transaminase (isomerizing)
MINPKALVFAMPSRENWTREMAVVDDMRALGGNVLVIAEEKADVEYHSGLNEAITNVLALPFGQMMALERALAKGLNPDQPNNLSSVIVLD